MRTADNEQASWVALLMAVRRMEESRAGNGEPSAVQIVQGKQTKKLWVSPGLTLGPKKTKPGISEISDTLTGHFVVGFQISYLS